MYRLNGQDASWLYRETQTAPMHTLKIFLVKLAAEKILDFESVMAGTPRLLHEVPMLRQRPVFVPFGLHHPVMIEDPEFDLRYHLNRAAVPPPWQPEPIPGKGRLVRDALKDHIKYDIGNLPAFFKAMYRLSWVLKKQADPQTSPTLKSNDGKAPRTSWNRALSSRRSFATAQMQLDELKALKEPLGGTLNDVILAIVAGALRNYLLERNELPDEPLVVTVPVLEGLGLNITVWSYANHLNFTLVACMKSLPEIDRIAAGLELSRQELMGAATVT